MAGLASKVFAITGGASGMGLATCRRLAALKAKAICIADFNDKQFESIREELKSINPHVHVSTTRVDVADSAQVDSWIAGIVKEHNALDGAVNAAGIPQKVGVRSTPTILGETNEMWDRVLGINLAGVFHCNRAQIKAMTELNTPKLARSIVNISSMASFVHGGDCYSYGVSKTGVAYLSTCIAKDVSKLGIRVNTISPSATKTPMLLQFFEAPKEGSAPLDTSGFNLIEPDAIAQAAIWLLSDDSSQVMGINMAVGDVPP